MTLSLILTTAVAVAVGAIVAWLLMRASGARHLAEATAAQAAETRRLLSSTPASVSGDEQQSLWDEQIRAPWAEGGTIVRLSWLPSKLPAVVAALSRLSQNGCQVETFTGRALGSGLLRLDGDESAIVAGIAALRASEDVGHVVMLRATPRLKSQVDVWGPASGTIEVARALKRMFDPADVLNAGRGPI